LLAWNELPFTGDQINKSFKEVNKQVREILEKKKNNKLKYYKIQIGGKKAQRTCDVTLHFHIRLNHLHFPPHYHPDSPCCSTGQTLWRDLAGCITNGIRSRRHPESAGGSMHLGWTRYSVGFLHVMLWGGADKFWAAFSRFWVVFMLSCMGGAWCKSVPSCFRKNRWCYKNCDDCHCNP
jgi:hypothetical protein